MNRYESDVEFKSCILGIVITVSAIILIPILLRKMSIKIYKAGSKVTEEDFINNGPEIVKKEREEKESDH